MFRGFIIVGVLTAALGMAGEATAQRFSNVIVFGDSLSDSGNVAAARGLPPGTSFTTNPDPVWAERVAAAFGAAGTNSLAGGANYAWGGACANPDGPCLYQVPTVKGQVDQYLAANDGRADPEALYAVWAGANDIESALDPRSLRTNPQADTLNAARALVTQVRRLQEAGARHVVVFNLPDLGRTPLARGIGPQAVAALSGLATAYNAALAEGLGAREEGIVPVNVSTLVNELLDNPGAYGITDTTGTACTPGGSSLACGPAGSGAPVTWAPGTNQSYLFADANHPGGAAHAMLASAVTSTLAAPVQVSLAGEGGVAVAEAHRAAVFAEQASGLADDRSAGSWHGFATARVGRHELGSVPRLGEAQGGLQVLTLGGGYRAGPQLYWGAALSFGNHDNDVSGASLDSTAVVGSVHAAMRSGRLRVAGVLSGGTTSVDVERSIALGPATRPGRGSTRAGQLGGALDLGWFFGEPEGIRHGPFTGLSWIEQRVDGYRESGNLSTAMNFSDFDRDSLVMRIGYQVTGNPEAEGGGGGLRPYARVAWEREFESDPIAVGAGSNTMPGRFTLPGYAPARQWVSADLGLAASAGERTQFFGAYSGRFGSDSRRDHRVSVGLRIAF